MPSILQYRWHLLTKCQLLANVSNSTDYSGCCECSACHKIEFRNGGKEWLGDKGERQEKAVEENAGNLKHSSEAHNQSRVNHTLSSL